MCVCVCVCMHACLSVCERERVRVVCGGVLCGRGLVWCLWQRWCVVWCCCMEGRVVGCCVEGVWCGVCGSGGVLYGKACGVVWVVLCDGGGAVGCAVWKGVLCGGGVVVV